MMSARSLIHGHLSGCPRCSIYIGKFLEHDLHFLAIRRALSDEMESLDSNFNIYP